MNVFLTEHPKVVIQVDNQGNLERVSTNIHPTVEVTVVYSDQHYAELTSNLPFEVKNNKGLAFES